MADRQLSDDDLGLLVYCAADYDRRLARGRRNAARIPDHIWELLTLEWMNRINYGTPLDPDLGAEIRSWSSG